MVAVAEDLELRARQIFTIGTAICMVIGELLANQSFYQKLNLQSEVLRLVTWDDITHYTQMAHLYSTTTGLSYSLL